MPFYERGPNRIYYEDVGSGFPLLSGAFAKRTIAAEESCTTGVMTEGRMAGGVATVWEREGTV